MATGGRFGLDFHIFLSNGLSIVRTAGVSWQPFWERQREPLGWKAPGLLDQN